MPFLCITFLITDSLESKKYRYDFLSLNSWKKDRKYTPKCILVQQYSILMLNTEASSTSVAIYECILHQPSFNPTEHIEKLGFLTYSMHTKILWQVGVVCMDIAHRSLTGGMLYCTVVCACMYVCESRDSSLLFIVSTLTLEQAFTSVVCYMHILNELHMKVCMYRTSGSIIVCAHSSCLSL